MDDPRRAAREFVKEMCEIDRSKHADEILRDFCEMSYCALAKTATADRVRRDRLEAQYMDVVRRYPGNDLRLMGNLLGRATMVLQQGGCDFLGLVAGEIGMLDARMGQFFTPYEISALIAEMNLAGVDALIDRKGYFSVHEPAAGAGGMLIAVADVVERRGHDLARNLWADAVELSRTTFHMAYVQMSLRGIAGRVVHGNSLSLEIFTQSLTPAGARFPHRPPHLDPDPTRGLAEEMTGEREAAAKGRDPETFLICENE